MPLPKTTTMAFVELLELYRNTEVAYPALKEVSAAQWALECGWGTSALALNHMNYAGMKWRSNMHPYAAMVRHKAWDGFDLYCSFPTQQHFIAGYWARFDLVSAYEGWEDAAEQGPVEFINKIGPIWYGYKPADQQQYVNKVLMIVENLRGTV